MTSCDFSSYLEAGRSFCPVVEASGRPTGFRSGQKSPPIVVTSHLCRLAKNGIVLPSRINPHQNTTRWKPNRQPTTSWLNKICGYGGGSACYLSGDDSGESAAQLPTSGIIDTSETTKQQQFCLEGFAKSTPPPRRQDVTLQKGFQLGKMCKRAFYIANIFSRSLRYLTHSHCAQSGPWYPSQKRPKTSTPKC